MFVRWKLGFIRARSCDDRLFLNGGNGEEGMGKREWGMAESLTAFLKEPWTSKKRECIVLKCHKWFGP